MSIITKISFRNMKYKKSRTFCTFFGMFISILLLIIACFIYNSLQAAFGEYLRNERTWGGDAGIYVYSQDDLNAVKKSNLVRESCEGYHLGAILDEKNYVLSEVVYYTDLMCEWMHCVPIEGRMPESENEIIVSDDFLEKRGLEYHDGINIKIEYTIAGKAIQDEFTIVGYYESKTSVKDLILVSESYYAGKKDDYIQKGANETEFPILVEVLYIKNHSIEALTEKLINETSLDVDTAEYIVNIELKNIFGLGMNIAAVAVVLLIAFIGCLLIINTYEVSLNNDIVFYRLIKILGVNRKELLKIIFIQMQMIYIFAVILAVICGTAVSKIVFLPLINRTVSLELPADITPGVIIIPIILSFLLVVLCTFRIYNQIQKHTGIYQSKRKQRYKRKNGLRCSNLLYRMTLRRMGAHKKGFVLIATMLFLGVLLCNGIYSYVKGFDIEKYINETMIADYVIHSSSFSERDDRKRQGFETGQLADIFELDGGYEHGGASVEARNIVLDASATSKFEELNIPSSSDEKGNMYTNVYGVESLIVSYMDVLDGEIDIDKFMEGNYVILDSLGLEDTGKSCWDIGDTVHLQNDKGAAKEYQVMAIVTLPYDLSYQSKWEASSNIFLPESEWQDFTGKSDYYMYMFNVNEANRESWDKKFEEIIGQGEELVYESAKTKAEKNKDYFRELKLLILFLMCVILLIVLGGFFNIIINEMTSLKNEVINLQRIGVARNKLMMQFVMEGSAYILAGIVSGVVLSPFIVYWVIYFVIAEKYVVYVNSFLINGVYLIVGILVVIITSIIYRNNILVRKFIR